MSGGGTDQLSPILSSTDSVESSTDLNIAGKIGKYGVINLGRYDSNHRVVFPFHEISVKQAVTGFVLTIMSWPFYVVVCSYSIVSSF
jgi:hypothetical protein